MTRDKLAKERSETFQEFDSGDRVSVFVRETKQDSTAHEYTVQVVSVGAVTDCLEMHIELSDDFAERYGTHQLEVRLESECSGNWRSDIYASPPSQAEADPTTLVLLSISRGD